MTTEEKFKTLIATYKHLAAAKEMCWALSPDGDFEPEADMLEELQTILGRRIKQLKQLHGTELPDILPVDIL